MLSNLVMLFLALDGVSAFSTFVDHNSDMSMTVRATSGYSLDEFNSLVDAVTEACDSNGCDGSAQQCNIAHCISIDGDNLAGDFSNILDTVGQYIKDSMTTEDTTIDDCTSSGCGFLPALNYTIPGYISLKRSNDDGSANVLYKIDITTTDVQDACAAIFTALQGAGALLDGVGVLGAVEVAVCQ